MPQNFTDGEIKLISGLSGVFSASAVGVIVWGGNADYDTPPTDIDSSIATCNIDEKNMILKIIDTQSGEMMHAQSILGFEELEKTVTEFYVAANHRASGTGYTIDLDSKTCTLDHGVEESVYQLVSP